jgi:hypothetical protein
MKSLAGNPYDGHTLKESLAQVEWLAGVLPKEAYVDRGYKGHGVDDTAVWIAGTKRGVTLAIKKKLKRRNAVEPVIGHMKNDGRLGRNFLKGAAGDAINALRWGAGHNLRKILLQLALLHVRIRQLLLRFTQQSFSNDHQYRMAVIWKWVFSGTTNLIKKISKTPNSLWRHLIYRQIKRHSTLVQVCVKIRACTYHRRNTLTDIILLQSLLPDCRMKRTYYLCFSHKLPLAIWCFPIKALKDSIEVTNLNRSGFR